LPALLLSLEKVIANKEVMREPSLRIIAEEEDMEDVENEKSTS
jgi:hypothetical protein